MAVNNTFVPSTIHLLYRQVLFVAGSLSDVKTPLHTLLVFSRAPPLLDLSPSTKTSRTSHYSYSFVYPSSVQVVVGYLNRDRVFVVHVHLQHRASDGFLY